MSTRPPVSLPAWAALQRCAAQLQQQDLRQLCAPPERFAQFSYRAGPLLLDLSKQRLDTTALNTLLALAEQCQLPAGRTRLLQGEIVNLSENRPALHTALRAPYAARPAQVRDLIETELQRLYDLAARLTDARWRGHSGKAITDIVHIGIGGSHLGPAFVLEALAQQDQQRFRCHFLANVDGALLQQIQQGLNPETTLFILVSKSFSTIETKVNAESARSWLLERGVAQTDLHKHFVAVTANAQAALAFGIAEENLFAMWDWVGGRYSLWSAVGLPLLLILGRTHFDALLAGAHQLDTHFASAPLAENLPVLLALIGIWNYNFLGASSQGVLCYDHRLRNLTNYLQQLETESNGKSVGPDGIPVATSTMPVLWGGEEPNGQHSFHQLLHQGTTNTSLDFIFCRQAEHWRSEHQQWLLASALSQSEALLRGRRQEELDPTEPAALRAQRAVAGNKPSTSLVLDALTPTALGALLALYEHKVYCQSLIWHINPFDQWGVELGKVLGQQIHNELGGGTAVTHDASTLGLIRHLRHIRGEA